jgi:hypothetical protein
MEIDCNLNKDNNSITISDLSDNEFDSVRIILNTLTDHSYAFNGADNKNISLKAIMMKMFNK